MMVEEGVGVSAGADAVPVDAMYVVMPCSDFSVPLGVPVAAPPRKQSGQDMVGFYCGGDALLALRGK